MSRKAKPLLIPPRLPDEPPVSRDRINRLLVLGYPDDRELDALGDYQAMMIEHQLRARREKEWERGSTRFWGFMAASAVGAFLLSLQGESTFIAIAAGGVAFFCVMVFATGWMSPP